MLHCFKKIRLRFNDDGSDVFYECCVEWLYMLLHLSNFPNCPAGVLDNFVSWDLEAYKMQLQDRVSVS